MNTSIKQYLISLNEEDVIYAPNPGNAGDSIIAASTYQLFDEINLKYEIYNKNSTSLKDKVLIYGGGGNIVSPNSYSTKFLLRNHHFVKKIVILPHTIKNCDELIESIKHKAAIFCREYDSLNYLKSKIKSNNIYIDNDMAFNLDINKFIAENKKAKIKSNLFSYAWARYVSKEVTSSWTELSRALKNDLNLEKVNNRVSNGSLNCFRIDGESNRNGIYPDNNVDLSDLFTYGAFDRKSANYSSFNLIQALNKCTSINTDRLHIGITAALMGIKVNLYPGNYYKIKSIYEYSIRDKFPNVSWHD